MKETTEYYLRLADEKALAMIGQKVGVFGIGEHFSEVFDWKEPKVMGCHKAAKFKARWSNRDWLVGVERLGGGKKVGNFFKEEFKVWAVKRKKTEGVDCVRLKEI